MPSGVDGADLAAYCLMLGDDALVASQRLTEWVTRAPELEDEVALANVALDLLGQARLLLARAAQADPVGGPGRRDGRPEDALAYFREQHAYRNVRLCELDNGDFARSLVRLLVFSTWRLAVFARLTGSRDPVLAAIAAKGVKELTYHRDYAARWVVRLGDSTPVARERVERGLADVWPWVDELFRSSTVERRLAGRRGGPGRPAAGVRRGAGPGPRRGRPGGAGRAAGRAGRRPHRAGRRAHRGAGLPAGRDAVGGPRPPRGDLVSRATPAEPPVARLERVWAVAAEVLDPELPCSRWPTSACCGTSGSTATGWS